MDKWVHNWKRRVKGRSFVVVFVCFVGMWGMFFKMGYTVRPCLYADGNDQIKRNYQYKIKKGYLKE